MTDIYLTTSLSTHNGNDTPQNYELVLKWRTFKRNMQNE